MGMKFNFQEFLWHLQNDPNHPNFHYYTESLSVRKSVYGYEGKILMFGPFVFIKKQFIHPKLKAYSAEHCFENIFCCCCLISSIFYNNNKKKELC